MKTTIRTIILAVAAMGYAMRGMRLAANTYDAAVETHESAILRLNAAAIAARHLLYTQSIGDTVAVNGATDIPLGTIDNIETAVNFRQSVLLLDKGSTKKMVANGAISAGQRVFTAAGGKVSNVYGATLYQVGIALSSALADNDIIEVADSSPMKTNA